MQISGLPVVSSSPPQIQRGDIAERVQKDVQRESGRSSDTRPTDASLEELRVRSEEVLQQRIESSEKNSALNTRQRAEDDNLPLKTRRALQTFADNTPSAEQQLGIELVGVDTFA